MVWFTSHLLLAVFCVGIASSTCPCPKKAVHNQEKFCNAHYVILARVLAVTDPASDAADANRIIRVQVIKNIHGPSSLTFGKEQLIYTPMACGIDVTVDRYYLFTGEIKGRKLRLYKCDWFGEWSAIDSCQSQHLINDVYKNNCDFCSIRETTCPSPGTCDYDVPSNVCEFNPTTQSHLKNAVCAWNGSECQWYRYCLAKK